MGLFGKKTVTQQTDDAGSNQHMTDVSKTEETVEPAKETVKKLGKKGGNHMMMSTTAGLIVGATVGGIAGAVLSDEETRKIVGDRIAQFARNATETAKRFSDNADRLKEIVEENAKTKA